ncbi:MAG TPA: response regulator [Candidatus Paceibacterota bacterium]|jgi:two-component system alkaline phosphatase synthesis response regulator PhoP|nr:response regulator [Candidatus Paceibacterota bacterium]
MREKPLILIVDDEPDLLEIMSENLRNAGFEPVVAHNGKEAIDAAKKLLPDLILMDIRMPGETGTDAALAIKQDPVTKDIKIAFLSSMKDPWPTTSANRDKLTKELGMEDYIDKTLDLPTTVKRVKEILAKK